MAAAKKKQNQFTVKKTSRGCFGRYLCTHFSDLFRGGGESLRTVLPFDGNFACIMPNGVEHRGTIPSYWTYPEKDLISDHRLYPGNWPPLEIHYTANNLF